MADAAEVPRLSYAEYMELDRASDDAKYELFAGGAIAMAGGSYEHSRLASRVGYLLTRALEGRRCNVLNSDMKVRVPGSASAHYPDVSVVCGAAVMDEEDEHALTNPTLIVEVTSPSTEGNDRGRKFREYRRFASLSEYVLVSQDTPFVELYRRDEGRWVLAQEVGAGGVLELASLDAKIAIDELYEDPAAQS